jgi:hypothetical protein
MKKAEITASDTAIRTADLMKRCLDFAVGMRAASGMLINCDNSR